ncbi:MAG: hypothetical protein IKV16_04255 [Clostridia bacterium]|nr:hypothetical protein [Clostridia bacterium]
MKERYIELMELTLSAYTEEHIKGYFDRVKREGLKEHGFPRLAADIGILIAHGRRRDLTPLFVEMMELCCYSIPRVKAANDFSVREVISCLWEIEKSGAIDKDIIDRWKGYLREIDPPECYDVYAKKSGDMVKNWALFTAVSEFYRQKMGLCNSEEFIDIQLEAQLKWLDENGMYMDAEGIKHHHINYDMVPRGLFTLLLNEGYRGKHFKAIDECLRKAGLLTLKMQSPNGEMGFGGRSNQFLYTEEWMITIFEYEARRYQSEGNFALAAEFKAASKRALAVTEYWLSLNPIRHIRNRFPTETRHGCEDYAYFDKYMITVASNLHAAYQVCDDSIPVPDTPDTRPCVFETSRFFHKLFLKAGGYGIEFDLDADAHYDANGLGRVHRADAPSTVCISVPCPENPIYTVTVDTPTALSICPVILINSKWVFATGEDAEYSVLKKEERKDSAYASLRCDFGSRVIVDSEYTVSADGVEISATGAGKFGIMLPAFHFDGEKYTEIEYTESTLTVKYNGWQCKYLTDGNIIPTDTVSANRNGYYKRFVVAGDSKIGVKIVIDKI